MVLLSTCTLAYALRLFECQSCEEACSSLRTGVTSWLSFNCQELHMKDNHYRSAVMVFHINLC